MSICFITSSFYPHTGGVEKHVYNLSRELIESGESVTVITGSPNEQLSRFETIEGIKVYRIRKINKKYTGLLYIWIQMLLFYRIFLNSDVIHVHDVVIWALPVRIVLFYKKFYATFHGWEGIYPVPLKNIFLKRLSALLVHDYLCVGDYIAKYYGIKNKNVTYGAVEDTALVRKPKLKNKVVFVGRLDSDTGVEVILKCNFSKIGVVVEFVGDGMLRKRCEKVGKVAGFINTDQVLQASSVCIASGYLTILEALVNKNIVVVIVQNKIREDIIYLSPFNNRIYVVKNSMELEELITKIQMRPNSYSNFINDNYKWAKKRTWKSLARMYLNLWQK